MTKYPGNPHWCQNHDRPKEIMTRAEWDQAADDGHLTPEHIFGRLHNIAIHAFGEEASIGFDDDGFVVSLTAASLTLTCGVKLRVYPNDHQPPHAHVIVKSKPDIKIRIRLDNGELMDKVPAGVSAKAVRAFQTAVLENQSVLSGFWTEYHGGDPIVIG